MSALLFSTVFIAGMARSYHQVISSCATSG